MEAVAAEVESPRVLLVEDEEPILAGLTELFRQNGFTPTPVSDGALALRRIEDDPPYDLVVLDLMLPGLDGLSVLAKMRGRGDDTPVLVLTARGAEDDVVAGLEAGADDYVTKPFAIRELVARARGLLRRPRVASDVPRRIVIRGVTIDFDALLVAWADGQLKLTARESSLLEHLAARPHRAVTREELLVDVWGYNDETVRTRTVDVHVQQLRAKLRVAPGAEAWIETVRGRGYRFTIQG